MRSLAWYPLPLMSAFANKYYVALPGGDLWIKDVATKQTWKAPVDSFVVEPPNKQHSDQFKSGLLRCLTTTDQAFDQNYKQDAISVLSVTHDGVIAGARELRLVMKNTQQHPHRTGPATITFMLPMLSCVEPPVKTASLVYVSASAISCTLQGSFVNWELSPTAIARAIPDGIQVLETGDYEITFADTDFNRLVLTLDDVVITASAMGEYTQPGRGGSGQRTAVKRYDCVRIGNGSILRLFIQPPCRECLPRVGTELVLRQLRVDEETNTKQDLFDDL